MKERRPLEIWFSEDQTHHVCMSFRIKQTLHQQKTQYQQVDVVETNQFGNMLILDGAIMTTEVDEFVYNELITHVAMNTHPNPRQILVIGGGDGGVIREVLRYPGVEKVILCEIDAAVIEAAREYLPTMASRLDDPRVQIEYQDGAAFVKQFENAFDVVIVDSTDPVGPGMGLFKSSFYQSVYRALTEQGMMVAQTESPWYHRNFIRRVYRDIAQIFPITRLYLGQVPTYPSGLWSFTIASKEIDPKNVDEQELAYYRTRYYHPRLHRALFELPPFVEELL